VPVDGDAPTPDGAVNDLIVALREYAKDWNTRLHRAPNHQQHRDLLELVELSDDAQLREWLLSGDAASDASDVDDGPRSGREGRR